jgi:hypothetical protein
VLFYKEVLVKSEGGNTLHCIVDYPEFQADFKLSGIPDDSFETTLDKLTIKEADRVIAGAEEFLTL